MFQREDDILIAVCNLFSFAFYFVFHFRSQPAPHLTPQLVDLLYVLNIEFQFMAWSILGVQIMDDGNGNTSRYTNTHTHIHNERIDFPFYDQTHVADYIAK